MEEWDQAGRVGPKPTPSPAHLSETLAPGAASTSVGRALPTLPACGVVTPERRFPPRPLAAGLLSREGRGKRPGGAGLCRGGVVPAQGEE